MQSMTGYGRGQSTHADTKLAVEIQSVNKRQIEIVVNLPPTLTALETDVRAAVASRVHRGRVVVTIINESTITRPAPKVNEPLARAYLEALRRLQASLGLSNEVSVDTL